MSRKKNPAAKTPRRFCVDQVQGGLWYQIGYYATRKDALAFAHRVANRSGAKCRVKLTYPSGHSRKPI